MSLSKMCGKKHGVFSLLLGVWLMQLDFLWVDLFVQSWWQSLPILTLILVLLVLLLIPNKQNISSFFQKIGNRVWWEQWGSLVNTKADILLIKIIKSSRMLQSGKEVKPAIKCWLLLWSYLFCLELFDVVFGLESWLKPDWRRFNSH